MSAAPPEWSRSTLNDLVTHETKGVDPAEADGLPYIGLEHIDAGEMSLARSGDPATVRSRKTQFEPGDILYGKLRPYLDKAVLAAEPGICSTDILVLRPKSGIDPYFAGALLHLKPFVAHAVATTSGVNHPRTSWNAIRAYEVAVPPLPEQRAIAHVLRTVQRAKEATEQVIAAAKELKKSLMRHLFTYGPVRVSPTNELPAWERRPLSEVVAPSRPVRRGIDQPGPHVPDGVPYVNLGDISDGRIVTSGLMRTSREIAQKYKRSQLRAGDVLVSIRATAGRVAVVPEELDGAHTARGMARISPADWIDSAYVGYFLQSEDAQAFLESSMRGVALRQVNLQDLRILPMPTPSREIQEGIASRLSAIDRKIAAEEARRDALATLFESLLHDLMTARLRAGDLKVPA